MKILHNPLESNTIWLDTHESSDQSVEVAESRPDDPYRYRPYVRASLVIEFVDQLETLLRTSSVGEMSAHRQNELLEEKIQKFKQNFQV